MRKANVLLACCMMSSLTGCSDSRINDPSENSHTPKGAVVSNAVPSQRAANAFFANSTSGESDLAYVSVYPGTFERATQVRLVNRNGAQTSDIIPLIDGGFDPVPVASLTGDTIDVIPLGVNEPPLVLKVPPRRPPGIVRTKPAKGRTDVALNVVITIVFTEPVDPKTVSRETVRLLKNNTALAGDVIVDENGWEVDFVPDSPLDPSTSYSISLGTAVKDMDGDALEAAFSASFVTRASDCGGIAGTTACSGTNVVTGTVVESPSGHPIANALVNAWLTDVNGTVSSVGTIAADSNGQFKIDGLPNATLQVRGIIPSYDQPCGVSVDLKGSGASLLVTMVSSRSPRPGAATTGALVSGTVLELVPDPDRGGVPLLAVPVAGVRLSFEAPTNTVAMTTTTDEHGKYAFCDLPFGSNQTIAVTSSGFPRTETPWSTDTKQSRGHDFILTRNP